MGQVTTPVLVNRITFDCEQTDCEGKMVTLSHADMGPPMTFHHRCNVCGHEEVLEGKHPRIEYVDASEVTSEHS